MPNPCLPRAALARLGLALALLALLFAPRLAHADDSSQWLCGPLAKARNVVMQDGASEPARVTDAQWEFLRGIFFMAPDTPASVPPGDHALIAMRPDGSATVLFVDGDQACSPMRLAPPLTDAVMGVGRGDIVHAGSPL